MTKNMASGVFKDFLLEKKKFFMFKTRAKQLCGSLAFNVAIHG
jgi:hypothetical protein